MDPVRLFGPGKVLTHDWLYALVFHREARLSIDGPDDAQRGAGNPEKN
jgi:hypothetical protein